MLVASIEILDEYQRVGEELSTNFPGVHSEPWVELAMLKAELVESPVLPQNVCTDAEDEFLACAVASRTKLITSGDKHLLAASGYQGIAVLKTKDFLDKHLKRKGQQPNRTH